MKTALITISIIILSVTLALSQLMTHAKDSTLRNWYEGADGYKQAIKEQQSNNKPIALFFHADWCKSCKALRETVLSTNEVKQYMSAFIKVKIEPEKSANGKIIADSYGVIGFPTFIILPGKQSPAKQIRKLSNISTQQFIDQCNSAI